ncbi:isochorismatase [Neisseria chenwenguii]|uniref:Isochorismatase n=1 Tax=Neisseria chenwenguii TaxID=1853278 RepID=A0A220S2V3_9NEIS|nr:isochorismatase family protein [Neisseria chenwenguii]ASK27819.1 isochorismatase [Neisseria chenwenguii]
MTIIAIDIQPQYRFTCMAANEQHFVHQPENTVDELNRQARFADKRLLIKNVPTANVSYCQTCIDAPAERTGFVFNTGNKSCRRDRLLAGLPVEADYDHAVETEGALQYGAAFHDSKEMYSTGLIEWLHTQNASTVILGGLSTEDAVLKTAKQLVWYSDSINVIVNLGACSGYSPESTLKAVYNMQEAGIQIATRSANIPELVHNVLPQFKVS